MTFNYEDIITQFATACGLSAVNFMFGYPSEVNQKHNRQYPLLVLSPATSSFANPFKNEEQLSMQMYLYREGTYSLKADYKNLMEDLRKVLKNTFKDNEHKLTINGGVQIERINDVQNDRLVGMVITLNINAFTICLLD